MSCRMIQSVIAVIILVVTLWPSIVGASASMWVTVVGAALLLLHNCCCKACCEMGMKKKK